MSYANWNGKIVAEDKICISPNNRSFRYGDGCFETIKVIKGNIILPELHFTRLFSSLDILKFTSPENFTMDHLSAMIKELVTKNQHQPTARVRLTIYRDIGGLFDSINPNPQFIIQSQHSVEDVNSYNEIGLKLEIFPDAQKSFDKFSFIKSNNYLPYVMAAIWAKEKNVDDSIICNAFGRVVESTIANIFIVTDGIIKTSPITEGCVDGTIRKYLLNCFKNEGLPFYEAAIEPGELLNASEVFLTNSIFGIKWVQQINNSYYRNLTSALLYKKYIASLFTG